MPVSYKRGLLLSFLSPLSLVPRQGCIPIMSQSLPLQSLDRFRSTRTRIAKRVPVATKAAVAPTSEGHLRDFSRYLGDQHPLRVIFIGHNPSDMSWAEAAPYAHKSNRFWKLVNEAGIVPAELAKPEQFSKLPAAVGVGFADLFVTSGSDASKVNGVGGVLLRRDVVDRILTGTGDIAPKIICCVSKMVAKKLLAGWNGDYGRTGTGKDWGLEEMGSSEVWVLPSTSGRAGLTWAQRLKPFQELADYIAKTPCQDEDEHAANEGKDEN